MHRPYLLLANYSPEGNEGGGGGDYYDPTTDEGAGDTVSTSLSGDNPPDGQGGADADGSNAGPALGPAGKNAVVEIKDITGKEPAPGAAPATKPAAAPASPATAGTAEAFAGFAGGANEFAEKILGREKGLIQFEGEDAPVAFADLTPEEKQDVINQHIATQPTKEERMLIENVRKAGGIDAYTQRRAAALSSSPAALSDDEVVQTALKKQFPDATDDELKAMFEHEKTNPHFNRVVANYRSSLSNEQKLAADKVAQAEQRMFVDTARNTATINGVIVSDDHRRAMLSDLLTPDESDPTDPTPKFIKQFDEPDKLLEVAWYYRYGKPLLQQYLKQGPPSTNPRTPRQAGGGGGGGGGGKKNEDVENPYE